VSAAFTAMTVKADRNATPLLQLGWFKSLHPMRFSTRAAQILFQRPDVRFRIAISKTSYYQVLTITICVGLGQHINS